MKLVIMIWAIAALIFWACLPGDNMPRNHFNACLDAGFSAAWCSAFDVAR